MGESFYNLIFRIFLSNANHERVGFCSVRNFFIVKIPYAHTHCNMPRHGSTSSYGIRASTRWTTDLSLKVNFPRHN